MTTEGDHIAKVNREASAQLAENIEKAKSVAESQVDARAAAKDKQVAEYHERKENEQPTPTQRENDLARVGALNHDDKEDDGSEWADEAQARVMAGNVPGNNPYETRVMESDTTTSRKKRRGGKRG